MFTFPNQAAAEKAVANYRANPEAPMKNISVHYHHNGAGIEARGMNNETGARFLFRNASRIN